MSNTVCVCCVQCRGEMVQGWSEATLTGAPAQSGRYSAWSNEEGEYDRAATEMVNRMFRCLNRALFEGRESGFSQTDGECREWSSTFPHLQVQGEHLFDTMDDGTEIAAPIYREDSSNTVTDERSHDAVEDSDDLVVIGRHLEPITLSDAPEEESLKEEVLAQHGVLEEYIAFDGSSANHGGRGRKRGKFSSPPSAPHNPDPPVSSIHQVVSSQVFDVLWSEVVTVLLPLLIATRDRALKVQSSRQSLQTSLATSHSTSPHESSLLLSRPPLLPTTGRATALHHTQYYQDKPATSSYLMTPPAAVLPRLVTRPPPLSGLMHIRPVSLRHRNMSLLHQSDRVEEILSRLSIHHHNNHTTTTTTAINHLQPSDPGLHNYYPRLPSLPYSPPVAGVGSSGYRGLYSGRVGPLNASRRPQQLRPIEHPRTPALERIESAQIRGYRLPVNAASGAGVVGLSPPPTAGGGVASGGLMGVVGGSHVVRNNQLPPLEIGGGTTGIPIPTEHSQPAVRGKSTFSQRNSSAAFSELQELRRLQLPSGGVRSSDILLRPSTTSNNFRADSGKPLGTKKLSDPVSHGGGGGGGEMKIVGHATGVGHSTSSMAGAPGMEGVGSGKMIPYSIAEGDEEEEWTEEDNGKTQHHRPLFRHFEIKV
ncbi:Protein FAM149A [Geodia barretti]|uniref:Protein FAM149A n=1 Tax=Geodia barretti TaxID=519541 RepID=A0AA35RG29_GEOBA|nr:Protein FAM149A [Geodia barretti]